MSKDGSILKNQIEPRERSKCIAQANVELKSKVSNDSLILNYARQRAKIIIENFLKNYIELVLVDKSYKYECMMINQNKWDLV